MNKVLVHAAIAAAALSGQAAAQSRDHVAIKGSSTVLPFATVVAEQFAKDNPKFKAPVVESGGSSAGLKEFCRGVGAGTIDIANSSRPIKDTEIQECKKNGVAEIMEIKIGYDGIVFASAAKGPEFKFTTKMLYLAVAAQVPKDGKLVANPYKTWKDIDPSLPAQAILLYIPGEKHGTREVFEEKVMETGCHDFAEIKAITDAKAKRDACIRVRKDGVSNDIDGDYTETLARLSANPQSVGVFGLSFYENNRDKIRVATVNDVAPTVATIASGKYPVSRPLFFYVKKAHLGVIPGLKEYVAYFMSAKMSGPTGANVRKGLIPLPAAELKKAQDEIKAAKTM